MKTPFVIEREAEADGFTSPYVWTGTEWSPGRPHDAKVYSSDVEAASELLLIASRDPKLIGKLRIAKADPEKLCSCKLEDFVDDI